ncbi:MAG: hypothetical protein GY842_08320 [bacterium]|nr:hypothetical protein [bacterium]
MSMDEHPPALGPPGAGLPWTQAFVGRHVLLPFVRWTHSWDRAREFFLREGRRVLALAEPLDHEKMATRALVRGVIGIEDSSRYWSVALAVEHLIIVGDTMAEIAISLSQDREPTVGVDIAGVKPPGSLPVGEVVSSYRKFLADFERRMAEEVGDRRSRRRLNHPWFGEIDAHQWACLAALHQRIHRKQIEAIVKGLKR